jgi:hypothetical protein
MGFYKEVGESVRIHFKGDKKGWKEERRRPKAATNKTRNKRIQKEKKGGEFVITKERRPKDEGKRQQGHRTTRGGKEKGGRGRVGGEHGGKGRERASRRNLKGDQKRKMTGSKTNERTKYA